MSKLLHVFFETDMRCGHVGLAEKAKKERSLSISEMKQGDMLMFVNRKRDRLVLLAGVEEKDSFGLLAYYRSPHGRIDENAFKHVPQAFNGRSIDMKDAIKKALLEKLSKTKVLQSVET